MPKNLPWATCFVEATILTLSESTPSLTTDADTEGVWQIAPVGFRVWETFELNQLKSAPSQLLPDFSGLDQLQTCCHSFGPANILYFFPQALATFFFIVNDDRPRTWALISKPVFQCSKIMKCNHEAKSFACSPFTKPLQAYNGHTVAPKSCGPP
jgi:hypothetical protein